MEEYFARIEYWKFEIKTETSSKHILEYVSLFLRVLYSNLLEKDCVACGCAWYLPRWSD